ncbi:MAG: hypothetical protein AAFN77_08605 [Planctomycetota bacterium]
MQLPDENLFEEAREEYLSQSYPGDLGEWVESSPVLKHPQEYSQTTPSIYAGADSTSPTWFNQSIRSVAWLGALTAAAIVTAVIVYWPQINPGLVNRQATIAGHSISSSTANPRRWLSMHRPVSWSLAGPFFSSSALQLSTIVPVSFSGTPLDHPKSNQIEEMSEDAVSTIQAEQINREDRFQLSVQLSTVVQDSTQMSDKQREQLTLSKRRWQRIQQRIKSTSKKSGIRFQRRS